VENEDGQEKTEEPSAKRLEDAKKSGDLPQSRELQSVGSLIILLYYFYFMGSSLSEGMQDFMRRSLVSMSRRITIHTLKEIGAELFNLVLPPLGLFLFLLLVAGVGSSLIQTGWHPSEKALEPNFEKLNPIPGFKKLFFSGNSLAELAKSLFKLAIVSTFAYLAVLNNFENVLRAPLGGIQTCMALIMKTMYGFMKSSLMWLVVLAVIDLIYQRYSHRQKLRMTKQEVRDEGKDQEGNPQVRSAIRAMAKKRLIEQIGLANLPKADVVITNPTHYAVALEYRNGEMTAPRVATRGKDRVAERIKAEARVLGIPVIENRVLARSLYSIARVGEEIPPELYTAVAEVLAIVFKIRQEQMSVGR